MSTLQRDWLWVESDTHGGHRQGLLNPETKLPEDDDCAEWRPVELTRTQKYLWELRDKSRNFVIQRIGSDPLFYFHLGDPTQGDRFVAEWVSTRKADQILIALDNARPVLDIPNLRAARYLMGTASHEFGEGTAAVLLDKLLRAEYPRVDIRTLRHGLTTINGLEINYAHHGPHPGIREWTRGNVARFYLRDRMLGKIKNGKSPARLYLRGHYHSYVMVSDCISTESDYYESTLEVIPSMCGIGAHGVQVTQSVESVTNGSVLYEIVNGEILCRHRLFMTRSLLVAEVLDDGRSHTIGG